MPLKLLTLSLLLLGLLTAFFLYRKKFQYQSYCAEPVLANLKQGKTYGFPEKVVVKPWDGRHNVYAVFMLANDVKPNKSLIVSLPSAGNYCGGIERVETGFEGVEAKPGYYLVKASLKTRTSTLLITRGFLQQLKDPRNWNLV
ncbi:MAG TPA: hypothetical protein V6D14_34280 [Coleofasciculaceae cyanobacterium]